MKRVSQNILGSLFLMVITFSCSRENRGPSGNEGSLICFIEKVSFNEKQIMIINPDGSEKKELFNDKPADNFFLENRDARWGSDRSKIVFASNRDLKESEFDLYMANSDGSDVIKVTDSPERWEESPDISTLSQIVFSAPDSLGNKQIFVVNSDGTNEKQLTYFKRDQGFVNSIVPRWSEDGEKIVFISDKDHPAYNIYTINADGSDLQTVTSNATEPSWNPSFSPDGEKIVYYTKAGSDHEIFSINADGTGNRQLTDFSNSNITEVISGDPAWSPDGRLIAFVSNKDKTADKQGFDLYVMNADGSNVIQLTDSYTLKFNPDWD